MNKAHGDARARSQARGQRWGDGGGAARDDRAPSERTREGKRRGETPGNGKRAAPHRALARCRSLELGNELERRRWVVRGGKATEAQTDQGSGGEKGAKEKTEEMARRGGKER